MTIFLPDMMGKERISFYLPEGGDNVSITINGKDTIHLNKKDVLAACKSMLYYYNSEEE
jgi:hypothetical protein